MGYKRETTADRESRLGDRGAYVGWLSRVEFGTPVGAKPDFPATNLTDVCEVEGRWCGKSAWPGSKGTSCKGQEGESWDGLARAGRAGRANGVDRVAPIR